MAGKYIYVYTVRADKNTKEWLSEPIKTGEVVTRYDWNTYKDSKTVQHVIYESDDEIRAIKVYFN